MDGNSRVLQEVAAASDERLAALARAGRWRDYEGPELDEFSGLLRDEFEQQEVKLCASGTGAVELALRGLQVKADDQVLLAGYDFPGNFRAIEAVGARPLLIDLEEQQWVASLPEGAHTAKAVIVSPLYGSLPPMDRWRKWCDQHGVFLLLDACQCPGARYAPPGEPAKPLSTWADATCLSFGGSKILTAGRGGAVLTNSAANLARMNRYTDRGNDLSPLSLLQAAALIPQLERLEEANRYRSALISELDCLATSFPCLQDPMLGDAIGSGVRVHYKKAWLVADLELRDRLLSACLGQQIPLGEGFRGFLRRTSRRCTSVDDLCNSLRASQQTILLHHGYLVAEEPAARIDELRGFFSRFS